MKNHLFLFAFLTCTLVSKAEQRFFPANSIRCINAMVFSYTEDKQGGKVQISPDTVYVEKWTGNDTIVDGKVCVTVWEMYERDLSEYKYRVPVTPHVPIFCGVIHEDENGYVYFKPSDEGSSWKLLYDFSNPNWKVGDKLRLQYDDIEGDWFYTTIEQVSSCTLCNGKVVSVADNLMYGIGYNNWPFLSPLRDVNPYVPVEIPISFCRDGELLWSKSQAQEIRQFIDTYRGFMLYENNDCSSFYLFGTHTIDDVDYVKDIDWRYFYRQDGNKIYCYSAAEKKEYLVMDFGLKVGDTFAMYDGLTVKVEQQSDTLMTCWWNEAVCKTLYLRGIEQPDFTDVWIEGVGSLRYGINPPKPGDTHLIYSSLYTEEMDIVYGFDFLDNDVRGMLVELGEYMAEKDFSSSKEYEAAHANNRMTFGLRNDTLYVGGYFGSYCEEFPYFLVKEDGEDIWISTARYPYDPEADCRSVNVIDFKIPGFTQERYTVHFGSMELVVTQGSTSVDDLTGEPTGAIYYDLMGRKVAHPTRGIYIKDGRKVMF